MRLDRRSADAERDALQACAIKLPVDLSGHDEVVLMEALDLLGLQDDFCMASSEIDFRVTPLGLCEIADPYDEAHCFTKILEAEGALEAMRIVEQFSIFGICSKHLGFYTLKRRNAAAAGRASHICQSRYHRSISPKTMSSEPTIADTSASIWPRTR